MATLIENLDNTAKKETNDDQHELCRRCFESLEQAEKSIRDLQKDGFDMKKLSIVGKDYHTEENVVGYYNAGDRMAYWGKMGALWGGFWGLLFGSRVFLDAGDWSATGSRSTRRCNHWRT